jgi:acetolactate synthase regulatory subunit
MTNDELLEQVDADLTEEVQQALQLVRDRGFAVAAFTPTELRGANPDDIEDAMVTMGWDAIDMNATEPRPDEEEGKVAS